MIYKNVEIHNIAEIIENKNGSVSWCRVPNFVYEKIMVRSNGRKTT